MSKLPKSNETLSQLPLDLPVAANIEREDLIVSTANQLAIDLLDHWPDWPSNVVIIAGPVGSGKSHLATIWAKKADEKIVQMNELSDSDGYENLVIENANSEKFPEEILFHIFNRAKTSNKSILITSRVFPNAWKLTLPDLVSRLGTAHLVELQEPDDGLLSGIIVKLFADRQIEVTPNIVDYLVNRMERSLEAAGQLVNWMDSEGLARNKKISRTMAKEALQHFGMM